MKPEDDMWLSNVEDGIQKGDMKEVEVISEKKGDSSKIEIIAAGLKITEAENNLIMDTNN
jgi:hypothetical protein